MGFGEAIPQFVNEATSLLMMPAQWLAQEEAKRQNLIRYGEGHDELTALRDRGQQDFDRVAGQVTQGYGDIARNTRGDVYKITGDLNRLYNQRYQRNMDYFEGAGKQERKDIDRRFDNIERSSQSSLRQRGLVGSTISPAVTAGNARRRSDAVGALEERLRGQRIGLDAGLSGDVAANYGANAWAGMNANNAADSTYLNNVWNTEMARRGFDATATGNLVGWVGGRTDSYPNEALYAQQLQASGQAQAPAPNYPNPSMGPAIAGSAAPAIGATVGKIIAQYCLDGETPIRTPAGPRKLKDIHVGDTVIGDDGAAAEVLERDYGAPWDHRRDDYLMIDIGRARRIILTKDHIIGGKPAVGWQVGDWIPIKKSPRGDYCAAEVVAVRAVAALPSGDLRLAGDRGYQTDDGFVIHSMMSHYGIKTYRVRPMPAATTRK